MLRNSTQDDIALTYEVSKRLFELDGAHVQYRGTSLQIPTDLSSDYLNFTQIRDRHRRGDFRNSEAELRSVKQIAQWTLDVYRNLRNQPTETLVWKD